METRQLSFLVVDDQPPILEILGYLLAKFGHTCEAVQTAQQALDLAGSRRYDCAVVDYKLGDEIRGTVVIQKIKQLSKNTTFCVLCTGNRVDLLQLPPEVDRVWSKPFGLSLQDFGVHYLMPVLERINKGLWS